MNDLETNLTTRRVQRLGDILESRDDNTPIIGNEDSYKNDREYREYMEYKKKRSNDGFKEYTSFTRDKEYKTDEKTYENLDNNNDNMRMTYYIKLDILRKHYKDMGFLSNEVLNKWGIKRVINYFKESVKRINVIITMNRHRQYLVLLWATTEGIAKFIFKLPSEGYTKNQLKNYDRYRMTMMEIGELQNQDGEGVMDTWSPYLKLAAVSVFNAALFVILNFIVNKFGIGGTDGIVDLINSFINQGKEDEDVLRRVNEADEFNPDPTVNVEGGNTFEDILSNLSSNPIISNIIGSVVNGMGNNNNNTNQQNNGNNDSGNTFGPTPYTRRRRNR